MVKTLCAQKFQIDFQNVLNLVVDSHFKAQKAQ